jgi:hypothetical protein
MPRGMKSRSGFRRALWASAALHAVGAGALVALSHWVRDREPARAAPGIRTTAEPQVRVALAETDTAIEVQAPSPAPAAPSAAPAAQLPRGPVAVQVPRTLPPELLALLRKPASAEPVGGAVTEVPVAPGAANPTTDAHVKPAAASTGAKGATPIHGALRPNQTVVYVLDSSGSMGASGMFDAARAQLVATLTGQPGGVRFQVIAYAAQPTPLLASDGTALLMTEAHVRSAAQKLAALEPRGKSNHLAAVRAAVAFRPDVILVLTDSHDLTAAALKPVLAGATNATVFVGTVTPDGVQPPRAVK